MHNTLHTAFLCITQNASYILAFVVRGLSHVCLHYVSASLRVHQKCLCMHHILTGDGPVIKFVDYDKPPSDAAERLLVIQQMWAHSQYCMSGDCTLEVCVCVLQCLVVCCSVLQCVAECCGVLQCVAVCCGVLQYCSGCYGSNRCVLTPSLACLGIALSRCVCALQCVAVCCSVLQCVVVCCSVIAAASDPIDVGSLPVLYVWGLHFRGVCACCSLLQCVAVLYVLRVYLQSTCVCVAVCCSVLQCLAAWENACNHLNVCVCV